MPSSFATMRPAPGRTTPMMQCMRVLLPFPFVPRSATVSPSPTRSERSWITRTLP